MRPATIASVVVLALSTAAFAQVGQVPEERTSGNTVAANATMPDDTARRPANGATGNATAPSLPGAPSTALVNSADAAATTTGQTAPK